MPGHLIHIGYPKTGSTLLQHWFAAHPQIAYRKGGLGGFETVWQIAQEAAGPRRAVLWRVTSSETLAVPMPARPSTATDRAQELADAERRSCDLLADLFPGSSVLIVTRGFRSMILSSYSQYVRTGGEGSLQALMDDAREARAWDYDRLIRLYRGAFGTDRTIVLPYEALRDDPARFLRMVEGRLGLDPGPVPQHRVNESLSPVELAWYPRLAAAARRVSPRAAAGLARLSFANRLRGPIRLLQAVRPLPAVGAALNPDSILQPYRGRADSLRDLPEYAPYAAEYLI